MPTGSQHDPGRCLLCYANRRKRANYRGHSGYRKPRQGATLKTWEVAEMKKPHASPAGSPEGQPGRGGTFSGLPELWAFLTDDSWDDGAPRERATLLILMDGPVAKVWLNDRSTDRSAWSTGETVDEALSKLEEAIATNTVAWRTGDGRRKSAKRT